MTVLVDEHKFTADEVVQTATISIQEPDTFTITNEETEDFVIQTPKGQVIQYDENDWLLYNASLKALTNATLEQLLDSKLEEINTGIYQYINQVSTLKEQAIQTAEALVAKLQSDVNLSIATLTEYNNIRATETSSNALNIKSLQVGLTNANTNIEANASAIQTVETTVTDLTSEDGPITANAKAITALETTVNDNEKGVEANASAIAVLNTEVGIDGGGLIETVNNLVKQIDGVVETITGTQDVLDSDDNIILDAEPYASWKAEDDENGDDLQRALHTGDTYIKYTEDSNGVKTYVDSYRFSRGEITAPNTDDQGYGWFKIVDQAAIDALNNALAATDLADGKRRVFTTEPIPPYDEGDLWLKDGELYKCINTRLAGDFVSSDFDTAVNYTDNTELNSFINDVYSSDMVLVKDQLDHQKEFFFTDDASEDPKDAWTDSATRNLHNKDSWYIRDEQKAYIYDSVTHSWYQDTLANTQQLGILAAQQTADNKASVYYGTQDISDDWTDEEKVTNVGDLLVEETVVDNETSLRTYRWDGNQWVDISDSRITANANAITEIGTVLTTPNATYQGKTTVLTDLQTSYENAEEEITRLQSSYTVTTSLGTDGNKYITGFGLNSEVIVNADGSTTEASDFNIQADKFSLTHPTTLNQVLMNQDGLYFKKADGTTAKYLQFMHTYNNHPNGTRIYLNNLTRVPQVLMGLHTMPTYSAAHKDQDQSFTFSVEDVVDEIAINGSYSFKPVANLHLSANTFSEVLTGTFVDSQDDVKYSNSYKVETTLNPTTITFNIGSVKGTGTANEYYKRQCIIQMQKSTNNSTWYDLGTSINLKFGESLTTQPSSITYTGDIGAGNYIRLKFTFSNDVGTFTTGSTGYYDYQTASLGKTSEFIRGDFLPYIECNSSTGSGYRTDCGSSSYDGPDKGIFCVKGYCSYTDGYYQFADGIDQEYGGSECYSANAVRDAMLPGYTVTGVTFSMSNNTLAGMEIKNKYLFYSFSLDTSDYDRAPFLYYKWHHYLDSYYNSMSAYITTTISAKKWIEQTGSTTTKNTVTDLALQATAKEGIELATGTMNIIVVE